MLLKDIARYFPSIAGSRLLGLLSIYLTDGRVLDLFGRIIEAGAQLYERLEVWRALGLVPG